jgi:hypothetical protein
MSHWSGGVTMRRGRGANLGWQFGIGVLVNLMRDGRGKRISVCICIRLEWMEGRVMYMGVFRPLITKSILTDNPREVARS